MRFLSSPGTKIEISELRKRFKIYRKYLQSIKEHLSPSAFEFAISGWHYDYRDHKCPHDSWVESLTVHETGRGERLQNRSLSISIRLLGAFHDGHLSVDYVDVKMHKLKNARTRGGRGDWLIDEIRLSEAGFVLHEVVFSHGGRWLIEAKDISCEWQPLPD